VSRSTLKPRYIVGTSTGATFSGPWIDTQEVTDVSFHATWTGTTAGTLSIQGSNDGPAMNSSTRLDGPSGNLGATTIHTVSSGNPAGSASSLIIPLTRRAERWMRLVFTRSAGAGALSCGFCGKGS
jgi:hypothetical protein